MLRESEPITWGRKEVTFSRRPVLGVSCSATVVRGSLGSLF